MYTQSLGVKQLGYMTVEVLWAVNCEENYFTMLLKLLCRLLLSKGEFTLKGDLTGI